MRYKAHSPARSNTSQSDQDDDIAPFDVSQSLVVSPAKWSNHYQHPPTTIGGRSYSPMSLVPAELLISILKYLYSPKDLYNVMRVSRTWCQCSVELLWHKPNILGVPTLISMIQVLSHPRPTFHYARFIRRLNFLALGNDLTDSMFTRLAQCDRLERLTLVNCASLSGDAISSVLSRCPNLVAIDLTAVVDTNDKAIVRLATCAKRLQGINLTGCKKVTDVGIIALADNCPMLRRVKLSGVDQVTDEPISRLAKSCPLLLEMDLNNCKLVTDLSIRDIWTYSVHMRELRLSHLSELTDAAFPCPLKQCSSSAASSSQHLVPSFNSHNPDQLSPLVINRTFEHLRMLDLTACSLITDVAVEGVVSHAPKIRNLVLSKCVLLTDRSVENICTLGRHIHYLHLGHAAKITDRSVRSLARSCTRLRYVDFANCVNLTDMSVFELSSLPKLRRIGLVRVDKLTDEAVYALADRHATLERIHLSYCDQISVMAVHFLLQKLHKLTHLSLTGIPAFRQEELQQFCRQPPPDFNVSQRAAFCVYSGKGVSDLRAFLTELFDHITEMNATDDTEYEDDEYDNYQEDDTPEPMETDYDNEGAEEEEPLALRAPHPNVNVQRGSRQTTSTPMIIAVQHARVQRQATLLLPTPINATEASSRWVTQLSQGTVPVSGPSRRPARGFGQQPLVESSQSPPPRSPHHSDRSAATNHSNGAAFFRTYQDVGPSAMNNGALTPELNFAEIGHGRGAVAGQVYHGRPTLPYTSRTSSWTDGLVPMTGTVQQQQQQQHHVFDEPPSPPRMTPTELPQSPVFSHATRPQLVISVDEEMEVDDEDDEDEVIVPSHNGGHRRGRSVRRSLKNTFSAAEHYASNILFGSRGGQNGEGGSSAGVNPQAH